jgi:non-specific serine/threonine protein kinase
MPYLVKAIKTGQFEQVQNELVLQLESGQMIGLDAAKVKQIIATMGELYSENPLDEQQQIQLPEHQLMQVARLQDNWQNDDVENKSTSRSKDKNELIDGGSRLKWIGDDLIKSKVKELQQIKELPTITPPGGLQAKLRDYQLKGFSWLCFLQQHQLHGLLADDMGLGKTIQTLALLLHQKQENIAQSPSLLVAPTSLLGNWQAEAKRFTPDLKVLILAGDNRDALYQSWSDYDLVVTSYGIMNRDMSILNKLAVHYLILDEAQAIKNRKTQTAQAAKAIASHHRLCLSGTPVENHLGELWSMFDFLMPGFLGSEKLFQQIYQFPVEKDHNQERLQELQQRMAPFILRRTKSQVAKELPDKNEIVKMIDLNERQAHVYESIRLTMVDEIKQAFKDHQGNQILIGNALLRLRQVCCHPSLVKLDSVEKDAPSAKLDWLMTAIPSLVEEGRRILIFSSFTGMLSLIEQQLKDIEIPYLSLTGKTPAKQRTQDIKRFQNEEVPVYLISLKAGGAGINLTAADTVIHYDPWWNPAAEQQASDRAHRIGQDKQVFVYKLISRGTVEEKIYNMQQKKSELASQLLSADNSGLKLNEHQWQDLLKPIAL